MAKVVLVTKITVSPSTYSLRVGESGGLSATVFPSDATNKGVTWSSDNTSVVTVNNGNISAVGAGSAMVKATAKDGSKVFGSCGVTVSAVVPTIVTWNQPQPVTLEVGDTLTYVATISQPTDFINIATYKSDWSDRGLTFELVGYEQTGQGNYYPNGNGEYSITVRAKAVGSGEFIFISPQKSGGGNFSYDSSWTRSLNVIQGDPDPLPTPTVTVGIDGTASWQAVANASGYVCKVNGTEQAQQTTLTYQLTNLDTLQVKAVGDGTSYTDSDYSALKTYYVWSTVTLVGTDVNNVQLFSTTIRAYDETTPIAKIRGVKLDMIDGTLCFAGTGINGEDYCYSAANRPITSFVYDGVTYTETPFGIEIDVSTLQPTITISAIAFDSGFIEVEPYAKLNSVGALENVLIDGSSLALYYMDLVGTQSDCYRFYLEVSDGGVLSVHNLPGLATASDIVYAPQVKHADRVRNMLINGAFIGLKSPNGTVYRLIATDNGDVATISTEAVTGDYQLVDLNVKQGDGTGAKAYISGDNVSLTSSSGKKYYLAIPDSNNVITGIRYY